MTLTRKQRIEAYTYALFCALAYDDGDYSIYEGVCGNLDEWETKSGFLPLQLNEYPEFLKQKPRNCRAFWWDSQRPRISALCRAIEEAEKSKV